MDFGGLAFALIGGDSRADKRRAAVRSDPKAQNVAASVDRAARKKQIADGLRDIERKGKQRVSLATRIDQAGLAITARSIGLAASFSVCFSAPLTYIESKSAVDAPWSA